MLCPLSSCSETRLRHFACFVGWIIPEACRARRAQARWGSDIAHKYSILDGERRYRCVVELVEEGKRDILVPANIVEPPTKIAGLLYMFSIHNYRESWELMPTARGLKVIMEEIKETDTKALAKLTGLSEPQIERCKKLLAFPERYQEMSLDPDPQTRIPSNFWIELLPVLDLISKELPKLEADLGRDRIIDKLIDKYRNRKIKSVIHFRRVMESWELSEGDPPRRSALIRRLEEFVLNPSLETRAAFDEFVVDRKRLLSAVTACTEFISGLRQLRLRYATDVDDREHLRIALSEVEEYCRSLREALEGSDAPEKTRD